MAIQKQPIMVDFLKEVGAATPKIRFADNSDCVVFAFDKEYYVTGNKGHFYFGQIIGDTVEDITSVSITGSGGTVLTANAEYLDDPVTETPGSGYTVEMNPATYIESTKTPYTVTVKKDNVIVADNTPLYILANALFAELINAEATSTTNGQFPLVLTSILDQNEIQTDIVFYIDGNEIPVTINRIPNDWDCYFGPAECVVATPTIVGFRFTNHDQPLFGTFPFKIAANPAFLELQTDFNGTTDSLGEFYKTLTPLIAGVTQLTISFEEKQDMIKTFTVLSV